MFEYLYLFFTDANTFKEGCVPVFVCTAFAMMVLVALLWAVAYVKAGKR